MACGCARRALVWVAQHLVDLLAARHHRIERGHRLLEDHRHARAAQLAQPRLGRGEQVLALEQDLAARGFSALASRPITVKAITDLPEPDSPTRQTISPGLTVKLTFSTAWTVGAVGSATVRLRTSRTGFVGHHRASQPRGERAEGTVTAHPDEERDRVPRLSLASLGMTESHQTFLLIFGSSVSRRPSPMMLIASTVKARKMPG